MELKAEIVDLLRMRCGAASIAIRAGEFLFREGNSGQALYIVESGLLRVVRGNTVYETLKPGGIVGEMAIVDEGAPRSASVIAGTYAELLEIDAAKFLLLVAELPEFSLAVMRVMARRLRIMNQRHRQGAARAMPIAVWPAALSAASERGEG